MYIVQARPETVHRKQPAHVRQVYRVSGEGKVIAEGIAVGSKAATGKARVIRHESDLRNFQKGEILVAEITDPDWEPYMKHASAVVTEKGGRMSHAAIVSRELGIPSIVGCEGATTLIETGFELTIDCSSGERGRICEGTLDIEIQEHRLAELPETNTRIAVNIGSPGEAFKYARLPVKGVGLGRLEFIIASYVKIHPNALLGYENFLSRADQEEVKGMLKQINDLTRGYQDKKMYYVEKVAEGIGRIASAFWPYEVIIRFSDFKSNEYRRLIGGDFFEPHEENPMLGWRGAVRYADERFRDAFGLECLAVKKVREQMGLTNVVPMIPFCRTPEEGRKVVEVMKAYGLDRALDERLKIYVMCEIPSNVLLADEFLDIFDGMSIGSNDLTQLTLGLDRDAGFGAAVANETNPAVLKLVEIAIAKCQERNKYVGICGQAPSDYPEFARFLVHKGIESISLNPDAVIPTLLHIAQVEKHNKNNV